jgi:hypothetical protein
VYSHYSEFSLPRKALIKSNRDSCAVGVGGRKATCLLLIGDVLPFMCGDIDLDLDLVRVLLYPRSLRL